ncbi:N-formylglutamate amidohydrolase [uncultured Sphingomonas sp.]|uniref:N-formylglutamate amidohydrolase n=1 Tax=uncultured Sphingomonas sp. TaxID=158754 RepID=UPI0025E987E4|nr:N-formylglutamate amidohydrolase [uncultured Sphingomonas sp.]
MTDPLDIAAGESAPFVRIGPPSPTTAIVVAVPHGGRDYPPELLAAAAGPVSRLESLEDRHADLLITQAVAEGAVGIVARSPRAWIDLNRGEEDLEPLLRWPALSKLPVSSRARSGLGLIPTRIGGRELWRIPPSTASIQRRIDTVHTPYHAAIAQALDDAWRRFGHAVLLDCHSMPPLHGARPPQIVIGDRHGRSAAPGLAARLAATARLHGYTTALNAPYAGAYVLARHGSPSTGIHAVQVEIDRNLYLEAGLRDVSMGLQPVRALIADLAREACLAAQAAFPAAAE